jgi:NAD(P)-dependent dehydrogenase (short-subunit alcohol dehydrogenase family)
MGIGLVAAKRLADEGAFVYITGRNQNQLDKSVEIIGKNAVAVQGDVCNFEDLDRLCPYSKRKRPCRYNAGCTVNINQRRLKERFGVI